RGWRRGRRRLRGCLERRDRDEDLGVLRRHHDLLGPRLLARRGGGEPVLARVDRERRAPRGARHGLGVERDVPVGLGGVRLDDDARQRLLQGRDLLAGEALALLLALAVGDRRGGGVLGPGGGDPALLLVADGQVEQGAELGVEALALCELGAGIAVVAL